MKKLLIYGEDGINELSEYFLNNKEIELLIIRIKQHGNFSKEYNKLAKQNAHIFTLDVFVPARMEAIRFLKWIKTIPVSWENQEKAFFNCSEKGQYYMQDFSKYIGLNYFNDKQLLFCKDKGFMKKELENMNIKVSSGKEIYCKKDLEDFINNKKRELIIKPTNSDSCRGVHIIKNINELESELPDFEGDYIAEIYNDLAKYSEFCTDVIICNGKIVSIFIAMYPCPLINVINKAGINGSIILRKGTHLLEKELYTIIEKIKSTLDLNNVTIHLEFFKSHDNKEIIVSELGFRPGGGGLIKNYELSFGINYGQIIKDMIFGELEEINYTNDQFIGSILLPSKTGVVIKISKQEDFLKIHNVIEANIKFNKGDTINSIKTSFDNSGQVWMAGNTLEDIEDCMQMVDKQFELEVG